MYRMRSFGSLGQQTAAFTDAALQKEQPQVYTMAQASDSDMAEPSAPTCLTPEMVQLAVPCFTGQIPAGYDPNAFGVMCSRAKASGILDLPLCPGYPLPEIPSCLDSTQQELVSYCREYGAAGDDGAKNAICWAALKDPAYFEQFSTVPECGKPITDDPAGDKAASSALMWGGLVLLVALGGGAAYYYATR